MELMSRRRVVGQWPSWDKQSVRMDAVRGSESWGVAAP